MDALNPRRIGPLLLLGGALLSLYWLASKRVPHVEPAPLQEDLSEALPNPREGELLFMLSMETGLDNKQVEEALTPDVGPQSDRVDRALAARLGDGDPGISLSAVELCIRQGHRGAAIARPVLDAGGPGAAEALIVLSWTLPSEQARALMEAQLEGPLGALAALELSRLDPSPQTQAQLQALRDQAPEQDRLLLDYAARLAADPYADLPAGGL